MTDKAHKDRGMSKPEKTSIDYHEPIRTLNDIEESSQTVNGFHIFERRFSDHDEYLSVGIANIHAVVPDIEANKDKILRVLSSLLRSPGYLCVADLDAEDGSFHGPEFLGHKGFDREDIGQKARRAGFKSVDFSTAFQMTKSDSPGQKEFPVFLMAARK